MKKVIAIAAMTALVACGGASTTATTDSTAVANVTDTTAKVDSAVVETPTGPAKEEAEKPVSNEAIK